MPPLEEVECMEYVTAFPFVGRDAYGEPIHNTNGTQLYGRWVDTEKEVTADDGSTYEMVADVAVNAEVAMGSLLWRGLLGDYQDGTGTSDVELVIVRSRRHTTDVKGERTRYQYGCGRYEQRKS